MKEFIKEKGKSVDWKDDFRNISIWKNDNFDEIQKEFNKWKIEGF